MSDPVIRSIPLDRLEISPSNARKTPAGDAAFVELKASIASHGLLENLVAREIGPDTQGAPRFAVIAGGRRLAALTELATDGTIAEDHPVPCNVIHNGTADTEISLAENAVRSHMHPADQVEAFSALANAGSSPSDIAARFGVSERTVERRLRLGNAAPELLDAFRADQLDLETLKAFTVTTDRERQLAAWDQVKEQGYRPSAYQIKRMLTEERVPATAALARFVGVDTYEAAGGPVIRDLFADEHENGVWLEDPTLLNKLANDRLTVAANELATRWKWSEARINVSWADVARFGRVEPQAVNPTDQEAAEIDTLNIRHDELCNMDDDGWTEELVEESETLQARLQHLEAAIDARAVFDPEQIAIAGCLVTIAQDGTMQVIQGLVRPEDIPAQDPDTATQQQHDTASPSTSAPSDAAPSIAGPTMHEPTPDPQTQARKEAGVGIGLADDLRCIRTALVKAHLADNFDAAFDLTIFQLVRSLFAQGYIDHYHALDITFRETADRPTTRTNDDEFADWSPGEAMLADWSNLPFEWMEADGDDACFAALRQLSRNQKKALFAAAIARTLKPQLAFEHNARPEFEATVARLDIDFAKHVRPSAAMLWTRITKTRVIDIARKVLGIEWAHTHRKDKKAGLTAAMERAFAAGDDRPIDVNKDARTAALAWTPPGFNAYDKGSAEDTTSEADGSATAPAAAAADSPPADTPPAETTPPETTPADTPPSDTPTPPASDDHKAHPNQPAPAAPLDDTGTDTGATAPPALPAELQATVDSMNQVPTADGGPRVIINTVGFEGNDEDDSSPATTPPTETFPENGHDVSADPLDVPAFLRRS